MPARHVRSWCRQVRTRVPEGGNQAVGDSLVAEAILFLQLVVTPLQFDGQDQMRVVVAGTEDAARDDLGRVCLRVGPLARHVELEALEPIARDEVGDTRDSV